MSKRLFLLMAIMVVVKGSAWAAKINQVTLLTQAPTQYQKTEWDLLLSAGWKNPYLYSDIALDLIIVAPTGKKQTVPAFYVSGSSGSESLWKARYTPAEVGSFQYVFVLNQKDKNPIQTEPAYFSVKTGTAKGILHAHDNWTFRFDNGELFRGIGENICWESRDEDDSRYFRALHEASRFNYDDMVVKLAENGGNFFRVWMIYWNLPVDWKTVSNNRRYQNSTARFNESAMKRMDELVDLCDSLGVHMMVALDSHAGYLGLGWDLNPYNLKNGGSAKTPAEFFTLKSAREQYKCKLRLMVARWGYSPSIAAWEFFNEIDNVMYAGKPEEHIGDAVIVDWHDDMSRFLDAIDPFDHIITTSISHRDVEGLNSLKYIDVNQRHIYKNTQSIPATINEYVQKFQKPYLIGEFGYEWDWSKNFLDFANEMDSDFKRGLWYGLFSPTPMLPMSWWWEFFEDRGMMRYFKNVREIHENMLQSGQGSYQSIAVAAQAADLVSYGVRCGNKSYIYLFNPLETEQTVELNIAPDPGARPGLQYYDCELGLYHSVFAVTYADGILAIPDFKLQPKSDVVLILNQ